MKFQKGQKVRLGQKHSEETKKKLSLTRLGKKYPKLSQAMSGKNHPQYGKPRSEATKEKLRIANTGKKHLSVSGSLHPKWKGGSLTYQKLQAKIRDDYTCVLCGLREPEIMQVDHIQPKALYPVLSLVLGNLMTLCPNCHARKTIREKKSKIFPLVGKNQFRNKNN